MALNYDGKGGLGPS